MKQLIMVAIIVFLTIISLCGCTEEKSSSPLITNQVKTFALTLNDFPDGFYIKKIIDNPQSLFNKLDSYEITFMYNDTNKTDIIEMSIIRYLSIENASSALASRYPEDSGYTFNWYHDGIGDENELLSGDIDVLDFGVNYTYYAVAMFRIKNVLVVIEENQLSDLDNIISENGCYSSALSYARIIESRINSL